MVCKLYMKMVEVRLMLRWSNRREPTSKALCAGRIGMGGLDSEVSRRVDSESFLRNRRYHAYMRSDNLKTDIENYTAPVVSMPTEY